LSFNKNFLNKNPLVNNGVSNNGPVKPSINEWVNSSNESNVSQDGVFYGVKPNVKTESSMKPLVTTEENQVVNKNNIPIKSQHNKLQGGGIASGLGDIAQADPAAAEFVGSLSPGVGEVIDAKDFLVDMKGGNYGGAALSAAGFALPFVSGKAVKKLFGYGGDAVKKAPPPKNVDKSIVLSDRDISDYNYAVDMGVPGIKDVSPNKMDDLLKSKFNTKPMYRAVDVNTPLSAESKNIMRSEGLNPDNLEHVAEYMGTHIPLRNITNKGRRTGHDKILEGSGKDIMYTSSDPEWIVNRYGGKNPYVVKTYEDQLPKNRIDQINKLSTKYKEPDWRVIDRKNLDLNKIPSGASIDKNALSVPGATGDIKMILGKYGEKVRDGVGVISGKDLAALRARGVRF